MHAREEGVAPGGAALLGIVVREECALVADAINVGSLADHQPAMVDTRLHPPDVVTHDEKNVGPPGGRGRSVAAARLSRRGLLCEERCSGADLLGRCGSARCEREGSTQPNQEAHETEDRET